MNTPQGNVPDSSPSPLDNPVDSIINDGVFHFVGYYIFVWHAWTVAQKQSINAQNADRVLRFQKQLDTARPHIPEWITQMLEVVAK